MRIIAGIAKSRHLKTLPGLKIRPTSDRVKESIFNMLADRINDARVLDLFAGTGNLGLEALSRGAKNAIFIDNHKSAIQVIQENVQSLGFQNHSKIKLGDVEDEIRKLGRKKEKFDLIFMDPPYLLGYEMRVVKSIHEEEVLTSEGYIILEYHKKTILDKAKIPFQCYREKRYGDTMVTILENQENHDILEINKNEK